MYFRLSIEIYILKNWKEIICTRQARYYEINGKITTVTKVVYLLLNQRYKSNKVYVEFLWSMK